MFELRWKVECWVEYRDECNRGVRRQEKPVLQYRLIDRKLMGGIERGEWQDVPTEYIDE